MKCSAMPSCCWNMILALVDSSDEASYVKPLQEEGNLNSESQRLLAGE